MAARPINANPLAETAMMDSLAVVDAVRSVDDGVAFGADTPAHSRRPWAFNAASSFILRASPLPRPDAMAPAPQTSEARILVLTSTLPAAERRLPSPTLRMSTLASWVSAALAIASLNLARVAASNSASLYGIVTVNVTKCLESAGALFVSSCLGRQSELLPLPAAACRRCWPRGRAGFARALARRFLIFPRGTGLARAGGGSILASRAQHTVGAAVAACES